MTDYMRDAMDTAFKNRQETSGNIPIMEISDFIEEQMEANEEYWQDIHDNIDNLVYAVAYAVSDHLVDTGHKALQDRIDALEQENEQLWGSNAQLQGEYNQLWNTNGELVWLNESQRQSISDLVAANTSVAEQNTNNHDDLLVLRDENRDILDENTQLRGENDRLRGLLNGYDLDVQALNRDVSRLEANLDSCMDARTQLLDRIDKLEADSNTLAGAYLDRCREKWELEERVAACKNCCGGSSFARHPSPTQ